MKPLVTGSYEFGALEARQVYAHLRRAQQLTMTRSRRFTSGYLRLAAAAATTRVNTRDETELLRLCARVNADSETRARISDIAARELDWEYFYQLTRRHAVLPLVYTQLKANAETSVPAEQLARFKKNYQANLARNLFLTAELCDVVRALAAEGIEAIPYKGPALALFAYGSLALRRFVDLDILVPKAQLVRAKELLVARGFVCDFDWTESQLELLLRTQHNLPLSRESGRLIIELHWEVASSLFASGMRVEDLSARLNTIEINGLVVPTLSTEDLLLSLCVHGSKHFWERLAWICDVAEIVKTRSELNWEVLMTLALASGNDRMLLLGLWLANELLQAPLPDSVKTKLDGEITLLGRQLVARLFGDGVPLSLRESIRFNWKLRNTWKARMKYCGLLFQPNDADIKTVTLPRRLTVGYYFMRPFGMLKRDRKRRTGAQASRLRLI